MYILTVSYVNELYYELEDGDKFYMVPPAIHSFKDKDDAEMKRDEFVANNIKSFVMEFPHTEYNIECKSDGLNTIITLRYDRCVRKYIYAINELKGE